MAKDNPRYGQELEQDLEQQTEFEAPAGGNAKHKLLIGVLLGGLITAGIAYAAWAHYQGTESTDNAQVDGHIIPVAAKIPGSVLEVLVKDNQMVHKGDVLVRIDDRDYQVRVNQAAAAVNVARSHAQGATAGVPLIKATTTGTTTEAEAALGVAQAELARAKTELQRAATADVAAAEAAVAAARAQAQKAQADVARMRPLVEKEEISKLQFDAYTAAEQVTASQLKAAQEQLAAARQTADTRRAAVTSAEARVGQTEAAIRTSRASQGQIGVRAAEAASAAANIDQAGANLDAARLQLSYAVIVAPVDGLVTRKSVEPGQIIQPGQPLMSVVPVRDVWVTANFKETQLAGVKPGQRAEVKVDLDGRVYPARIDSIAGATGARLSLLPPENATGNFVKVVQRIPVKIVFESIPEGALLRPGMSVDATIFTK